MKLYKKAKNGKTLVWNIDITPLSTYDYSCSSGYLDGCLRKDKYNCEAKGGRTLEDQIKLEVKSKTEKKKNAGYVEDIKNLQSSGGNQLGLKRPMLASIFNDKSVIDFSCTYVQRKYDGHRCIITKQNGAIIAYSRGGKPITSIEHITGAIELSEGQSVDGELYVHGVSLQKISSMVRKQSEQSGLIDFIVYDSLSDGQFSERLLECSRVVNASRPTEAPGSIILSETSVVYSIDDIRNDFDAYVKEGYEGIMIRTGPHGYEHGKRSKNLLKMKSFIDDEFLVVGMVASREGYAILRCKTKAGKIFSCTAPGNFEEKRNVLENIEHYIGKYVNVRYPCVTDRGLPSQPVAIYWRDKTGE